MRGNRHFDRTKLGRQKHKARACLSQSEIGAMQHVPDDMIVRVVELLDELLERRTTPEIQEPRHVLHRQNVGANFLNEISELA
jgi:hypothetical protein